MTKTTEKKTEKRWGYLDIHGNLVIAPDDLFEEGWADDEVASADIDSPSDGPHKKVFLTITYKVPK